MIRGNKLRSAYMKIIPNDSERVENMSERQNRTTRHLENDSWKEYLVAWRKDKIEIYRDHVREFLHTATLR